LNLDDKIKLIRYKTYPIKAQICPNDKKNARLDVKSAYGSHKTNGITIIKDNTKMAIYG